MFGLGSVIGPLIGANLFARTGNPRNCYFARAVLAIIHMIHNVAMVPETLPLEKRKAFSLSGVNPFGFLKLLGADSTLRRLVAMVTLMSFCEMKNLNDVKNMWLKNDVGLSVLQNNNEQMAYGATLFIAGRYLAPYLIKDFGGRVYTSIACWATAASFALMGAVPAQWAVWLGLLLHAPGINATGNNAVKAAATDHAVKQGYGKGEFGGYVGNLRALTVVIAPVLYGQAYAFFVRHAHAHRSGKAVQLGGGRIWWVILLCAALIPELLHQTIRDFKPVATVQLKKVPSAERIKNQASERVKKEARPYADGKK